VLVQPLFLPVYHLLLAAEPLWATSCRRSHHVGNVRMQYQRGCDTWDTCVGALSKKVFGIAGVQKVVTRLYLAASRGHSAECTLGRNRYVHYGATSRRISYRNADRRRLRAARNTWACGSLGTCCHNFPIPSVQLSTYAIFIGASLGLIALKKHGYACPYYTCRKSKVKRSVIV